MLLSGTEREKINCAHASRLLTDVSAAFGHAFSLLEGTMEPSSFVSCLNCQAVFAGGGETPALQGLLDELGMPLLIRSCCVPESLCGRGESPAVLYVASVLSLDEDTLRPACRVAFHFAQEMDCRLCSVPPSGASRQDWEGDVRAMEAALPQVPCVTLTGPEAITALITNPQRMGLVLCPPYAGSMLTAAGTALCGHPEVIHEFAVDPEIGVYVPWLPDGDDDPQPFSAALALAKLLRLSLRLGREAACVEAAVNNVLTARTRALQEGSPVPDPDGSLDLICEQIAVAGELMQRAGLG